MFLKFAAIFQKTPFGSEISNQPLELIKIVEKQRTS